MILYKNINNLVMNAINCFLKNIPCSILYEVIFQEYLVNIDDIARFQVSLTNKYLNKHIFVSIKHEF